MSSTVLDFAARTSVQSNKLVHEVLASLLGVSWVALKVGKAELGDGANGDLGLEQIHLVQE